MQNSGRIARKTNGVNATTSEQRYVGRFAPSPTGPLHFGSLYTALASFLQARSQHGLWHLRIDDLDTARNMPGAADAILKTLDAFGLHWDGAVIYQSRNIDLYTTALQRLLADGMLYRCICSRKTIAEFQQQHPHQAHLYPGLCREAKIGAHSRHALRIKTDEQIIRFEDGLQGIVEHSLPEQHGDFIVFRRDNIIAYHLAAAVDDRLEQITEVTRGYDLLDATPKQIFLQQLLGFSSPRYLHVPIITDAHDQKLSKQSNAEAVDRYPAEAVLFAALELLQQKPPQEMRGAPTAELLNWAIANWEPESLRCRREIRLTEAVRTSVSDKRRNREGRRVTRVVRP